MGSRPAPRATDRARAATRRSDDPRQAVLRARKSASRTARGVANSRRLRDTVRDVAAQAYVERKRKVAEPTQGLPQITLEG